MTETEVKISMCNQFLQQLYAVNEDFIFSDKYADIQDKLLSKEKTLELLISTRLIKQIDGDKYILDDFGSSIKVRFGGVLHDLPKPYNDNDIDKLKFRKELISFLEKLDKKRGDISELINATVDRNEKRKQQVQNELADLCKRETIEFYGGDSYLLGHNVRMGDEAEDKVAGLTNKYLDKSWWDKQPTGGRILIGIGMPLIVALIIWGAKLVLQNYSKTENSTSTEQLPTNTQTKRNVGDTTNDTLHGNKGKPLDTLTPGDTNTKIKPAARQKADITPKVK